MTSRVEEQELLRDATNPRIAGPRLTQALGLPPGDGRLCRVLDVRQEPGLRCAILYSLPSGWVSGTLEWATARPITGNGVFVPDLQLWVDPIGYDPLLPGMPSALDGERLWAMAGPPPDDTPPRETRLLRSRVTAVRYRPGIRFTSWAELCCRSRRGAVHKIRVFAKAYRADGERSIVASAMRQLTSAGLPNPRLAPVVAEAPELELLLQGAVPGASLEGLLVGGVDSVRCGDQRGPEAVLESARALAAIHSSAVSVPRSRSADDELAELHERSVRTERAAGTEGWVGLATDLARHAERLNEWGAGVAFTHGDCKPNQMLVHEGAVAILDFDLCAMADPALDVGTYRATLRQLGLALRARSTAAPNTGPSWLDVLGERFLDEYCLAARTNDDFRFRATFYEAAALLRKSLRAFARSPRSPIPAWQLAEARRCLASLPAVRPRRPRRS